MCRDNVQYCSMKKSDNSKVRHCLCRSLKITLLVLLITIIILCLLSFRLITIIILCLLIFIGVPIAFMCSVKLQTFLIFMNIDQPSDPEYDNFAKYNVHGIRNIYASVRDVNNNETISLGVWHLLPEELVDANIENSKHEFDLHLYEGKHPTIIYFHGNSGTRIYPSDAYIVFRKYFHVIAFDYRNYADSTPAALSEEAVVSDSVQVYKWVKSKTRGKVFVWGHSLGTGISTHTLKRLHQENIVPMGLFLEAPFLTIRDAVASHPLAKIFSWLPYFTATILDPLEENGFYFKSKINILSVDCPIMIMNAEDDIIIPYTQGKELAEIAQAQRDPNLQGEVFYHKFDAKLGYNHMGLTQDPTIPEKMKNFIDVCNNFHERFRSINK